MKKREMTVPTVAGLLIAVAGLISGLWLLGGQIRQAARADTLETPNEVRVVNVNDTGFTVTWLTNKSADGFLQYGETSSAPDLVVSDERDQQKGAIGSYFTHYVTVRGLKPGTEYGFKIGSGRTTYDQGGQAYKVTTARQLETAPAADVAYGRVVTPNGEPAEGAVVYISMADMAPQAALVKATGAWVIPLSTARSEGLADFAVYDTENGEMRITVLDGPMGTATASLTTQNDSPVPDMILGQTYDFREEGAKPETGEVSKFSADSLAPATEVAGGEGLNILAPMWGEKVNSLRPEIIGEAPPGVEVTIEIQSDPISGKAVAGTDGRFSFSVPADLEPGEHTITVTAIVDGVAKQIARSFTVYAAGESSIPAFSATPSATLAPSKAPTPTVKPTVTLKPSVTPRPSATPTPTPGGSGGAIISPTPTVKPTATPTPTKVPTPTPVAATASAIPRVGVETPTILVLILGMGLVVTGGWWYRRVQ